MNGKKIIYFGVGGTSYHFFEQAKQEAGKFLDETVAFSDNNPKLWGTCFMDREVISPEDIVNKKFDYVVILSIYEKEIYRQLVSLGIPENKVLFRMDYWRKSFVESAYFKRYGDMENSSNERVFNTDKLVIYTTITGDYDDLKDPLYVSDDITYVCFTNNKSIKSDIWNVEYIHNNNMDNLMLSKYVKMNPHKLFKEYETSIYVDGKIQVLDDMRNYVRKYEKTAPMLSFPHYDRDCIYDEAAVCAMGNKKIKIPLINQISSYLRDGFPVNWGLFECACMVRNHHDDRISSLMEQWMKEVERHSKRDQISFPYLCWKNNFIPDISDLYIMDNPWIYMYPHKDRRG